MQDYTLDINEYTELELFKLIKYNEDIREANNEKITLIINKLIDNINNSDADKN